MTYIEVLEELSKISSTNQKENYLVKNKDVQFLKEYLAFAIDIRIKFNVVEFKYEQCNSPAYDDVKAFENFLSLTTQLCRREITGNIAQEAITALFSKFSDQQQYWLGLCLKKDSAQIGVGRKIVNKIWPGLVLDFKVSLAESEDELDKFEFGKKASLELKLNGIRTIVVVKDGIVEDIYGRSGLPINNFAFIIPGIEAIAGRNSFVLDGEVHVNNSLEDTMSLFGFDLTKTEINFISKTGKVSSAWKKYQERKVEIIALQKQAKYSIFDYLEIEEWDLHKCVTKYQDRRTKLINFMSNSHDISQLEMPPYHEVTNYDEAMEYIQPWIDSGLEGGILKTYNHLYSFKRDYNWLKIKEEVECDVEIVDIFISKQKFNSDGTSKADMMGEALVRDRDGRQYKIGTGKYLSEERRVDMWNNKDSYIGKIYYVTAQRFTEDAAICPRLEYQRLDRTSLEE